MYIGSHLKPRLLSEERSSSIPSDPAGSDLFLLLPAAARGASAAAPPARGARIAEVAPPITGTSGDDVLIGGADDDTLSGLEGDDLLYGMGGIDTTDGGPGNDVHYVEGGPHTTGDIVIERDGEGTNDRVITSGNYVLNPGAYVESIGTSAEHDTAPLYINGNELPNSVYGNAGHNTLYGGGGGDYLVGMGGDDFLYVSDNDNARGGTGNDIYYVIGQRARVYEDADEGYDTLRVTGANEFQLTPGAAVEVLEVDPHYAQYYPAPKTLIGNELDNVIRGYRLCDSLHDGGGADILEGEWGGDFYYVSDGRATIFEEADPTGPNGRAAFFAAESPVETFPTHYRDSAFVSVDYTLGAGVGVELLSTYWQHGFEPIDLTGNELDNWLIGNDGDNVLDARGGWNIMHGLGGNDVFAFSEVDFAAGDQTHIIDFEAGADRIFLDDVLFGLTAGALSADAFRIGSEAADADDRIIYDKATGILYFDPDGTGAAEQAIFARFDLPLEMQSVGDVLVTPDLTSGDFFVF